jgi:hypothetical protein
VSDHQEPPSITDIERAYTASAGRWRGLDWPVTIRNFTIFPLPRGSREGVFRMQRWSARAGGESIPLDSRDFTDLNQITSNGRDANAYNRLADAYGDWVGAAREAEYVAACAEDRANYLMLAIKLNLSEPDGPYPDQVAELCKTSVWKDFSTRCRQHFGN